MDPISSLPDRRGTRPALDAPAWGVNRTRGRVASARYGTLSFSTRRSRPSRTIVRGGDEGTTNLGPSVRLPAESTTIWSIVGSPAGIICSSSRSNRRVRFLLIIWPRYEESVFKAGISKALFPTLVRGVVGCGGPFLWDVAPTASGS